jgi:NTP pyrophosphatase (non-canonical NTP hydrolase)
MRIEWSTANGHESTNVPDDKRVVSVEVSSTVDGILASLKRRGFYHPDYRTQHQILTQIMAVQEELGELASMLRRSMQGKQVPTPEDLQIEAADIVIAAVCLLGQIAGSKSGQTIVDKMRHDEEKRGYLHGLADSSLHTK